MARVRQRIKVTRKTRRKKIGKGYKKCPNCGGDGRVKIRK